MKKFISNVFTFLIIILLFNIVTFVFANDNYYKDHKDFPDKNYHSIILADSHGIPLGQLSKKFRVYNFSANSDSYFDMKRKILYLIENHYKINTIYITVDDHTLSPYRDRVNNTDKSVIYTSTIDFNYLREKYFKFYLPIFQSKVNPLFRTYLENKVKQIYQEKNKRSNNIVWSKLSEEEKNKRAGERVEGQFPSKNKSEKLQETLLEIISLCKVNKIELIGVKFPLSASYLKLLGDRNYGADLLFVSNGLKIVDYKSIFVHQDEYFGDQDHLNPKGGEEFVKILLTK